MIIVRIYELSEIKRDIDFPFELDEFEPRDRMGENRNAVGSSVGRWTRVGRGGEKRRLIKTPNSAVFHHWYSSFNSPSPICQHLRPVDARRNGWKGVGRRWLPGRQTTNDNHGRPEARWKKFSIESKPPLLSINFTSFRSQRELFSSPGARPF